MTILKPKNKNNYILFFTFMAILIIVGGISYIYQYNVVANKRFQINNMGEEIVKAGVKNAEVKNKLYQNIDSSKLELMADEYSLVLENNPDYMNINQWITDSSF